MQSNRSHISTVRRLSTDAAAQEANAHASALAEMDAAISGLGDWQRQRELDLARLRLSMMRNQGEDEDDAALRKGVLYSDGGSKSDSEATFLTASDSCASSSLGNNCEEINNDDGDDPASRAYEDRLRAELAALQHRREKLEQQSLTDREEASGSGVLAHHHHMPTDLLISQDQLDQLTKDTRRHVGKKSVVALRSEVRELEAAAFDKQLRADQNRVTDPEMLREEDVTRVAKEEHGFTEVFGLGNALSEYMSGLDDMMLKLDAVDAAVEASQLSSRRGARSARDDREERDDLDDVGKEDEGETRGTKSLKKIVQEVPSVAAPAPVSDSVASPEAERNSFDGRGRDVLVPESF